MQTPSGVGADHTMHQSRRGIAVVEDARFQICRNKEGDFYFRLLGEDGATLLSGSGYRSKDDCLRVLDAVRGNAAFEESYERTTDEHGKLYFQLLAPDPVTLGSSLAFSSRLNREHAIATVMSVASRAPLEDIVG